MKQISVFMACALPLILALAACGGSSHDTHSGLTGHPAGSPAGTPGGNPTGGRSPVGTDVAYGGNAGADSSGGGDKLPPDYGSAWFLGTKEVKYCVEVSPTFGLDQPSVSQAIADAVGTWQSYVDDRKIQAAMPRAVHLDLNFQPMFGCDGTEDLKFLFGVENEAVARAKSKLVDPSFLAYRDHYDINTGWGKGFIWVAPMNRIRPGEDHFEFPVTILKTALTHELGHVLGCGHVQGTIMREDIVDQLDENYDAGIDDQRFLMIGGSLAGQDMSEVSLDSDEYDPAGEVFQRFSGKKRGVRLERSWKTTSFTESPVKVAVTMASGNSIAQAAFESTNDKNGIPFSSAYLIDGPDLFKVAYRDDRPRTVPMMGAVIYGTIRTPEGTTLPAGLELNMNNTSGGLRNGPRARAGMYYIEGNEKRYLFGD